MNKTIDLVWSMDRKNNSNVNNNKKIKEIK